MGKVTFKKGFKNLSEGVQDLVNSLPLNEILKCVESNLLNALNSQSIGNGFDVMVSHEDRIEILKLVKGNLKEVQNELLKIELWKK